MKSELILKRDAGNKVKIEVALTCDHRSVVYRVSVFTCEKGKRTWNPVVDRNCYKYRATEFNSLERSDYGLKLNLEVVTEEEILTAQLSLWNKINPSKHRTNCSVY